MIVLGSFEGDAFRIRPHPSVPPRRITLRGKWIQFDGMQTHWSEPVTAGIRYSVVAFNFADRAS